MLDWSDLSIFLEVARHRSLSAAAKRLGVDHTTVGRRIRTLERELDCNLFTRSRFGLVLTDAGQRLLEQAEPMEAHAHAIQRVVGAQGREPSGTVRLASMEAIGSLYLAPRLPRFYQKYPDIRIELVTASHWINLSRREADVLISFPRPAGGRLLAEKIGEFQLRLYGAPAYLKRAGVPRRPADLAQHHFVDYIDDLVQIQAVRWLSDVVRQPQVVFRSTSLIAQYQSAVAGLGLAMLPSFVAARDPRLKPVLSSLVSSRRDLWLSVHEDLAHLSRIALVKRFLEDLIAEDQPFLIGRAP